MSSAIASIVVLRARLTDQPRLIRALDIQPPTGNVDGEQQLPVRLWYQVKTQPLQNAVNFVDSEWLAQNAVDFRHS